MIHALERVAIAAPCLPDAARAYAIVLGRSAREGEGSASFGLANVRLDLVADQTQRPGLAALAFAVDDLGGCARLLTRRRLPVERPLDPGSSTTSARLLADRQATYGVPIEFYARPQDLEAPLSPARPGAEATAVTAPDHLVIRTPNPERAIALYAGRLGLSLRLDRSHPEGARGSCSLAVAPSASAVGAVLARARPLGGACPPAGGDRRAFGRAPRPPARNPGLYGPLAHGRRATLLIGADADATGLAP